MGVMARFLAVAMVMAALGGAGNAWAADYSDMVRYVFAPLRDRGDIAVIDAKNDTLAGVLKVGVEARQLEISPNLARMIVADGHSNALMVVDLTTTTVRRFNMDFAPDRLLMSGDGRILAALSLSEGRVVFIDLWDIRVMASARDLGTLTDGLLNNDGSILYLAIHGREGMAMLDSQGRMLGEIAPAQAGQGDIASVARAPSGRYAFLKPANSAVISVADLRETRASAKVSTSPGVTRAYTNAVGITLILPDSKAQKVEFLAASGYRHKATLKGADGMTAVYSGWFDTVTFIPSAAERSVLVFDQVTLTRGDDITLAGIPGRGTVSPDGAKLYVPLIDHDEVAIIDAQNRRLASTVTLPGQPLFAVMGRTFGICH